MSTSYFRVNDLAPKDGCTRVYFKKVGEKKSDGFVIMDGAELWVLDAGRGKDEALYQYLLSLRAAWLEKAGVPDENARLELNLIISHMHYDHIAAFPLILCDKRFAVVSFYAPERSYRSLPGKDFLQYLGKFEDKAILFEEQLDTYDHPCRRITRLPFGKKFSIPFREGETKLTVYTPPYDWSLDRESDEEGFGLLRKYVSPTYADDPELGWANGVMNGNSLWVKAERGAQSVLITGDQRASEEMLGAFLKFHGEDSFRCNVLKLPHHGELNYCPHLLELAEPEITVFTCSEGYQTPETLEICNRISTVYHLCDGDLVLTLDGASVQAEGISPRKG